MNKSIKSFRTFYQLMLFFALGTSAVFAEHKELQHERLMAQATTGYMQAKGAKIRYAQWLPKNANRHQTIVLLQGRASFTEKHCEFIQDLLERGYTVFTFDWRGQGGSDRLLDHPQKGHVENYRDYLVDLKQFLDDIVYPQVSTPIILFGSSMGGHIAVRFLSVFSNEPHIVGAVLESPMFDIKTDPFPRSVAKGLVRFLDFIGLGWLYAPGYGDHNPDKYTFGAKSNTHDPVRSERQNNYTRLFPDYVTGGPTVAWVRATFDSIDLLRETQSLKRIHVPVLIFNAGQDKAVDNKGDLEIAHALQKGTVITYKEARHHIVVEIDPIRNRFWKDFDAFMETLPKGKTSSQSHGGGKVLKKANT